MKSITALLCLTFVCLVSPARAQNPITFTIYNPGLERKSIVVYDDVCHRRIFVGSIEGNSTISLSTCAHKRRYGNIRILNQATGKVTRRTGIMRSGRIRLK